MTARRRGCEPVQAASSKNGFLGDQNGLALKPEISEPNSGKRSFFTINREFDHFFAYLFYFFLAAFESSDANSMALKSLFVIFFANSIPSSCGRLEKFAIDIIL